jgi:hypothetical protein
MKIIAINPLNNIEEVKEIADLRDVQPFLTDFMSLRQIKECKFKIEGEASLETKAVFSQSLGALFG